MTAFPGEAECAVQQATRLIDFAERPQDSSQPAGGYDLVIEDEPGGKMVIALLLIGREGLFKVRPRAGVVALEPASYTKDVVWPARRWRSGREPGVTQASRRHLAHRHEVSANKAYQPHAVISREPRGGVFNACGKLAGARKRSNRLWLTVPATMKQCMTVRGLQPQPEEPLVGTIGQSLGQANRLFEMRDRLVVGGSIQRPVTRLDPPLDGRLAEPRLREMMGDDLGLDVGCLQSIAQGLGNPPVQHLPATLEQVLVGYLLHQRMLESVNRFRRITAAEHKLRVLKLDERVLQRRLVAPDQRAQQRIRELAPDRGADLGDLPHGG